MGFYIKDIYVNNQIILAPMAGVSNSPFRLRSRIHGAGMVYAEMVSDKGLIHKNEKTIQTVKKAKPQRYYD